MEQNNFKKMCEVDVSKHVHSKQGQKFLSWTYAWKAFKTEYKDANYKVIDSEFGIPYFITPLGIMVKTEVTANGETIPMHLPVMNGANRAMKEEGYEYTVKSGVKYVEPATMMDINKTIMRCLVKNIAMFGLGLFVYTGDDAPDIATLSSTQLAEVIAKSKEYGLTLSYICEKWGVEKIAHFHEASFDPLIEWIEKHPKG